MFHVISKFVQTSSIYIARLIYSNPRPKKPSKTFPETHHCNFFTRIPIPYLAR